MFNRYVTPESQANQPFVELLLLDMVGFDDFDLMRFMFGYGM